MMTRKAIFAGVLGNAIEWYDFALYGHFSVIIGQTFFPKEEPGVAMLAAFAVFSVSFFMRPLGAIIFSAIGDRWGRRKALSLSMLGMAIPTAGIGLLPPFADIGVMATVVLVILRLLQGLALGGEMGGAVTYVMEHAPERRIGFASSLIQASTCLGLLLGTVISSLISLWLTEAEFQSWGWRVPFLIGLVAVWVGFHIRRSMPESQLYELAKIEDRLIHDPVKTVLARHHGKIWIGVGILTPMTCCFFLAFVYFNSYMMASLHYAPGHALGITSGGLLVALSVTLLSGLLADRVGYKRILLGSIVMLLLGAHGIMGLLSGELAGEGGILPGFFGFAVLVGVYTSAAFAAVAGLFGTEVRYSGVSLAVNIASPLFGSTAPLLAAWLLKEHGASSAFAYLGFYLIGLCLFALASIWRLDHDAFVDWGGTGK